MTKKIYISWKKFEELIEKLCAQVKKEEFDNILCVSSGGLVVGKLLSDKLDLPLAVTSALAYEKGKKEAKEVFLDKRITSVRPLKRKILIVDDLVHTGKTMQKICNFLGKKYEIKTSVLYKKSSSKFMPDYYAEKVKSSIWIIFPYEKNEFKNLK